MPNDRNRKKSGKTPTGNHPAGDANGKVRAAAGSDRRKKRTPPPKQGKEKTVEEALPPKPKPPATAAKVKPDDSAMLIDRAREWARLHSNPRTRDKMDGVLNGLSERDKRRVVLCGQRIASGLSVKLINQ